MYLPRMCNKKYIIPSKLGKVILFNKEPDIKYEGNFIMNVKTVTKINQPLTVKQYFELQIISITKNGGTRSKISIKKDIFCLRKKFSIAAIATNYFTTNFTKAAERPLLNI